VGAGHAPAGNRHANDLKYLGTICGRKDQIWSEQRAARELRGGGAAERYVIKVTREIELTSDATGMREVTNNPDGRGTGAGTIALSPLTARWQQRDRSAGDCIGHLVRQQAI
jgi:hypothetical protein